MPVTVTRQQLRDGLKDREVALADIKDVAPTVNAALKAADLNGDGKISGEREVDAAHKALDDFDRNGDRESLSATVGEDRGVRVAVAMLAAAKPATAHTAPPTTRVRTDTTLRNFAGGTGPIQVANVNGKPAAVQFKADMDVDTDGGSSAVSRSDRFFNPETSMKFAGNRSLDSDKIPFIVLPPGLARSADAELGDLVEVAQGGKTIYAIFADSGPTGKIGEASMNVALTFDAHAGPNRAAAGTFTYTLLPGSGAAAGIRNGGPAKTAADIQAAGASAFANARALGIVT